jgi:hypothetical protein
VITIVGEDEAYSEGFYSYGMTDVCPYSYPDLKRAWRSGWFHGLVSYTQCMFNKGKSEHRDARRPK